LLYDKYIGSLPNELFYRNFLKLSVFPLGTLLLLPKLSALHRHDGVLVKCVTFVSLTSYSMYLLHYSPVKGVILPPVMENLLSIAPVLEHYEPVIAYIAYWVITIVLSYALYRFFEKPMTALRDKWPSRKGHIVKSY
jgi:peptidoglycan/LPS O-acetylase OafA/YrhL